LGCEIWTAELVKITFIVKECRYAFNFSVHGLYGVTVRKFAK